ncbi:gamma-glutamylcyclotransferase family protein [Alicyclobacillus mengziensis]|uniref:gamma-glutamylcyclotransferase family protein n=1 Tax=Alicyclobacillus mengziensis TaxID=2931921 RepID=UPI002011D272|nr:gamma-glutamylcyclotransferase family protein [Alicyclobacillus mengziensis]
MKFTSDIVERAVQVSARAHSGQTRKGSGTPYIVHPVSVAMILMRAGCDEEVVAAGLLHDTVEDTDLTLADVRVQFGERVAKLVAGASEPDKSQPWEARKRHTIAFLTQAPDDVRVLVCADKLDNVRSIRQDAERLGEVVWSRFHRGRKDQEWYYRSIVESLSVASEFPMLQELQDEVNLLFGMPEKVLVYVYGSLLRGELNHGLLASSKLVSAKARTRGKLYDTGNGYPAMVVDSNTWTVGQVYEVDMATLKQLDDLEDYHGPYENNDYDRISQDVETEHGTIEAVMYVYREEQTEGLKAVLSGDWSVRRLLFL